MDERLVCLPLLVVTVKEERLVKEVEGVTPVDEEEGEVREEVREDSESDTGEQERE